MRRMQTRCKHCGRLLFLVYSPVYGWLYVHPSYSSARRCKEHQARTAQKEQEQCKTTISK